MSWGYFLIGFAEVFKRQHLTAFAEVNMTPTTQYFLVSAEVQISLRAGVLRSYNLNIS
jgi:hypothetical protein